MDSIRAGIGSFIQMEQDTLARHEAEFQSNMRHLFAIIVIASLFMLLFSISFAYLIHRETQHRLKLLALLETRHLLEIQEATNKQLQQANATLQVSEEKLAVTLNSIGDAVIATDAEGRVTRLNPLAEQLTGWTQARAAGRPVDEIFHIINQETRQPAIIPVKETLAQGTIHGLANHTVLIALGGSECAIADSCAPIRDRDGKVLGAVLVFRDVTKEYAAHQALRDNAALIQTILNTVVDGIITLHASSGMVETVNPATERMFGFSAAELIGQNVSLLIPELDGDSRNGSLEYFSAGDGGARAVALGREVVGRRKDGSIFPLELVMSKMRLGSQRYFTGILRDITARKQAEEALLKAGPLQNAIFNSANFSSIATDAKGVIQIFNVGAERMLGYAAADVMNKITPADISDPKEVIARAKALSVELSTPITPGFEALVFKASRGIEDIYELTYIRKDGSRFPAVVSVTALRDAQDAIIGYLLIGTDNTARKRAEEALLKAGALQNAIFNSANFSSIATDAKGVIQIFNVGAERMLGYAAADVMNKITPADISDPKEVIARAKALSVELSTPITPGFEALVFKASRGIEDIYELTYIRKDGSRFPAIVSVTALRDAQKAIIGYLLIGTDNTARKQVEAEQKKLDQRLRDQQFYTRSLIESNIDALMMADPLGIITDVNKQMEALTGCTRDELIGAPFKNHFTDPERAEASIKLVLSEKKVTNYELTARARDGKQTVVSYNATTFYDRDRTLQGVFAAARDVTESKRLDQVLQDKNAELESARSVAEKANLAKSDFLSSMSHELRSPLNAILGFAQLMESADPLPTAPQAESIAQILQAGWHLLKLINEILDLAAIESGKVSLSSESVSLSEVMSECQAMMEPQAQQRGISMTFPRFDVCLFVMADRIRLKQIVINLLSNAIKYNKQGGTIIVNCTVSTPPPPDFGAAGPERIRISVADTGAGLPPEKLAQLFQPFNRLGQEAGGMAGTGIGLVVTKRLAELMSGVLGVESTVGVGSVFWCELVSAAAPQLIIQNGEVEASVRPQLPDGAPQRTLLYVEDNPANMKLVEQLIERCPDIRLLTAVNGTLGIELARAAQPQVILMDVNLPGISGIEALKILREDPATAHIPVVALSANAMPRDIATGLELGFFRYLTKPIKVKEFMETLNTALEFAEKRLARN
jgi:PAS domain S-box-containing protein